MFPCNVQNTTVVVASTYLYYHNLVASVLHWHLSKMYLFPLRATSWFTHKPQPVVENSNAKLLWDFSLVSASHHPSNRPDIVLFDYQNKKILFIEVSCPADPHVLAKEDEKIQKYCALASDFRIMYQMPVKIIPVVIGHSGVISSQCRRYLHDIPGYRDSLLCHLLKATILGTIRTLQTIHL